MGLFSRASQADDAPLPLPYDPASPEGLAARWVRWAASVGPLHNPVTDPSGADAGLNQPDDVFFLAGTFGGSTARSVAVPAGVPLFVPAVNIWAWEDGEVETLPRAFGDVVLDGVALGADRITTPEPFLVAGARANPVTRTRKPVPMVVTGLWKRLDPPAPGPHSLRVRGGDGHGFVVDLSVELLVG